MKLAYLAALLSSLALAAPVPNGGVLDNDTDPDGDAIVSATILTQPQHGTLEANPDGTFRYTPNPNFYGEDFFTYSPVDATGMQGNPTTVTITVNPVGDPPVGVPDHYETDEDVPLVVPPTLAPTGFRGSYQTAEPNPENNAVWNFVVVQSPGTYRVSATWPALPTAVSNAHFMIVADGRQANVVVNQREKPSDFEADGAGWKILATVPANNVVMVVLMGDHGDGLLVADAVRIEKVEINAAGKSVPVIGQVAKVQRGKP